MTPGWLIADTGVAGDIDLLLRVAAEAFDVPVDDLTGPRQDRETVRFRQISAAAIRTLTGMSYVRLGDAFNRDHTTIMNACTRVDAQYTRARDRLVSAMRTAIDEVSVIK